MGILYIVATPIGNLLDMTKRGMEVLESVDLILCEDTRTSSHLLNSLKIKNKLVSYHKFNEQERSREVIDLLKTGKNVAIITDAGTPCISDPGSILVGKYIESGGEVFSIPGPSAFVTALTLTGRPITNFAFYGFLERKNSSQKDHLQKIQENDLEAVVFYESPKRIIETIENIKEVMSDPYLVVLNDLTKKFEKKYYGNASLVLEELLNNKNHALGEYVIVVFKNKKQEIKKEQEISLEALLIDKVMKEKCTMKEAIQLLADEYKSIYSKKEFYNASLNIKKLLG